MKKILILIVFVALYLHFFPEPKISQWYEKSKSDFLQMLSNSTKVTFKADIKHVYQEIKNEVIGLSQRELENLETITRSTERIVEYYEQSCENTSESKLFHPDNADKICQKLAQVIK